MFTAPFVTVARDGTVTGYKGTKHLSAICDPTVDLIEVTVSVYGPDVSATALNRDKNAFGSPTVVVRANAFIAPASGGFTSVGYTDGKKISPLLTLEVAGEPNVGKTSEEKSYEHERKIRFIRGLRLGTHIVNLTNRPIEVSGTGSCGNGITFVAHLSCTESVKRVGTVATESAKNDACFCDTTIKEVPHNVPIADTVSGRLINSTSYTFVAVYERGTETNSDTVNDTSVKIFNSRYSVFVGRIHTEESDEVGGAHVATNESSKKDSTNMERKIALGKIAGEVTKSRINSNFEATCFTENFHSEIGGTVAS